MFLYSLLEVSEKATNVVKWISVGAVALLLVLIALFSLFRKQERGKQDARRLAFAGVCVASSFVLALLKFKFVAFGGSITIASFVPVLLFAYVYGPWEGFAVGLIHGLLNFIESPYILTPATFVLDYLLAFASIGIMGFFGKMKRKEKSATPLVLGCVCVFSARFIAHLLSGMIFFAQGAIWDPLPSWAMGNAFVYSLIYQCVYVPMDAFIATMVLVFFAKTGILDRLTKLMKGKK